MRHAIPSEIDDHRLLRGLKTLDKWHCWRAVETEDGMRKKPVNLELLEDGTIAEPNMRDPSKWLSYSDAKANYEEKDVLEGLQIFIDVSTDDFIVIDFDDCVDLDTGMVDPHVREYLRMTDTYAELSPSGTGIHMLVRGTIDRQGWPDYDDEMDGEIYDKYIVTVTEDHIAGTSYRAKTAPDVLEKYFAEHNVKWDERML